MAQNQCIFEYCNIGSGYLRIFFPETKKVASKEIIINLEDYADIMFDGTFKNIEPIVDRIKTEMVDLNLLFMPSIMLVLRCEGVFRNSITIPVKNSWQAKMLYNKELKARTNKDQYYTENNILKLNVGYTFNTYYIPRKIVDDFLNIAKKLGSDIEVAKPYGMYLAETFDYEGNYVYFHIKRGVCTMILVSDKHLLTTVDFKFRDKRDILNKFLIFISKYEFEAGKQKITHFGVSADDPVEIDIGLERIEEKQVVEETKKSNEEVALAKSVEQTADKLDVEFDNYDDDTTDFAKRYSDANNILRRRYDDIARKLLAYTGMKSKITEQAAVFHINSEVYAKIDIRDNRVLLYLATNPEKYLSSRYPCALTKRRGFDTTPCLYRIATGFRFEGVDMLIKDLATEKGLVPKPN